jgi:hypothetical protein
MKVVENTKKSIVLITCLLITLVLMISTPNGTMAAVPSINKVQGPITGVTTTNTLTAIMAQPTQNNVLIAIIGVKGSIGSGSISQNGVNWVPLKSTSVDDNYIQIWAGIITSASASTTMTTSLTGSISSATVDLCEYSGLNTALIVSSKFDQSKINEGSDSEINTGITSQTRWVYELWVGGAMLNTFSQSLSGTGNGFVLFDGTVNNGISLSYLQQTVSSKGTAKAETTGAGDANWVAAIVAIPAAPTITLSSSSGSTGTVVTVTGYNFRSSSPITLRFNGAPVTLTPNPTTTDTDGYFTASTFVVPSLSDGSYTVTANDGTYSASATYTILTPPIVTPENPVGVFASIAAIGLAFAAFIAVKRSKGTAKPLISI